MQSRGDRLRHASRRQVLAWLGSTGFVLSTAQVQALAGQDENPAQRPQAVPALFGSHETAVGDPCVYLPKSSVLDRAFADEPYLAEASASSAQAKWKMLLADLSTHSPELRIAAVDCFVNGFAWIDDDRLYRTADYWATPAEFLANEGGDCEDFAIVKYVGLAQLGFSEDRLRIALVYDRRRRLQHALTIVYWKNDAIVLDSLAPDPLSHTKVTRYRPICSFNRHQLWVHRPA
jgi:predicted transglutaminase-like cysteine proteinase